MKTLARPRDKAEILQRLKTVRAGRAASWGRMSAHQMVCHLTDAFRMATGQKAVSHTGGRLDRTLLKWVVLYMPLRWPAGILTSVEIDQEQGGTRPLDFATDVAELEALLQLTTDAGPRNWPRHPVFGSMSRAAWLRWAYLHVDHHLRQFGA